MEGLEAILPVKGLLLDMLGDAGPQTTFYILHVSPVIINEIRRRDDDA